MGYCDCDQNTSNIKVEEANIHMITRNEFNLNRLKTICVIAKLIDNLIISNHRFLLNI